MLMDPQSGPDLHIDESEQVHVKYSMAGQQLVVDNVVLLGRPLLGKPSAIFILKCIWPDR